MYITNEKGEPIYANSELILELRRVLWAEMVKLELRCSSIYELEKKFSKSSQFVSTDQGTKHPTNWYKYLKGEQSPSNKTVQKVSKKVRRAEYWFNLPMWDILEKPVSKEVLDQYLRSTRPDISNRLYTIKGSYSAELVRKKIRKHQSLIKFLCVDSSIDALNVIIILCAEIEANSRYIDRVEYYWAMFEILMNFCMPHPFFKYFKVLFIIIKERFFYDWDPDFDFPDTTKNLSVNIAEKYNHLSQMLKMHLEDLCVLMLNETSKANSVSYSFFRSNIDSRNIIIEGLGSHNLSVNKEFTNEMKKLIWESLKVKI